MLRQGLGKCKGDATRLSLISYHCLWFDWTNWCGWFRPCPDSSRTQLTICCCLLLTNFSLSGWCVGSWHAGQFIHLSSTLWLTGMSTKASGMLFSLYGPLAFALLWRCAKAAEMYKPSARQDGDGTNLPLTKWKMGKKEIGQEAKNLISFVIRWCQSQMKPQKLNKGPGFW